MVKKTSINKNKKIEASCKKDDSSKFIIIVNSEEVARRLYVKDINPNKTPTSKFKGVRLRQWGRYCAEICDPFAKTRKWLGTFDDDIEAAIAYSSKKDEFEERKLAESVLRNAFDINQSCKECGGRKNYDDPSNDDDNNNIGGGGSNQMKLGVMDHCS